MRRELPPFRKWRYHSRMRRILVVAGVPVLLLLTVSLLSFRSGVGTEDSTPLTTYQSMAAAGETPPLPVVERAARSLRSGQDTADMIYFLTSHVARFPDDPVNGYYLTLVGNLYHEQGIAPLTRQYYRRALLRYPDVRVRDVGTHRVAINRLLEVTENPRERITYLHQLQENYPDEIDRGLVSYYLGLAYEKAGRWPEAFESFRVFLAHPQTVIPGQPQAAREIARKVALYDTNRQWTQRNLDDLVGMIKHAIWTQNPAALLRHRSGHNFFTMSWQQDEADANSYIPTFDIGAFLRRSRVRYAADLELSSNAREAYLRTWGWSHRIPTWYLYFRRVDFLADPEVHGNWEWAGILFGEAF